MNTSNSANIIIHMSKKSSLILTAVAVLTLVLLNGCGDREVNQDTVGPPIPDTPRETSTGAGAPLFLFGGGGLRGRPGENDEEYQEYLLWKEWQQYQKYQEWLRTNQDGQPAESQSQ